jgi:hypothetical protein
MFSSEGLGLLLYIERPSVEAWEYIEVSVDPKKLVLFLSKDSFTSWLSRP